MSLKIAVFYGSTTCYTEMTAEKIQAPGLFGSASSPPGDSGLRRDSVLCRFPATRRCPSASHWCSLEGLEVPTVLPPLASATSSFFSFHFKPTSQRSSWFPANVRYTRDWSRSTSFISGFSFSAAFSNFPPFLDPSINDRVF